MTGYRLLACGLAALAAGYGYGSPAAAQTKQPLKIGALSSATGRFAIAGTAMNIGAKMAAKDINAAGGIDGRQVELVFGDDQGDPTLAVGEAKRLVFENKVDLIFGPLLSAPAMATLPIFTDAKMAQISSATTLDLTPQAGPYHFSITYTVFASVQKQIDFADKVLKAKKIGMLGDPSATAKTVEETMRKELPPRHMELAAVQTYQIGDTDFTPQILAVRRADPDVVELYVNSGQDAGNIIKTMTDIGWSPKIVTSSGIALFPDQVIKVGGPHALDNVYPIQHKAYTYCPGEPVGSGEFPKFAAKMKAFAPDAPSDLSPAIVAWYYDAMHVFKAAIEASGGKTDGPTLAAWIETDAHSLHLLDGVAEADKASHFMFSTRSLTLVVHPEKKREDGLQESAECAK